MTAPYRRIVVSVPGKLILMGEHAAVYGKPALIAAADPRARVEAEPRGDGVQVDLADLGLTVETSWQEVRTLAVRSREAWQRYVADPSPSRFADVGTGSPTDLVRVALGEIALSSAAIEDLPVALRVSSRLPIGSGFGSSASIAVAVIGAILNLFEDGAELETIDRVALEVERRQHGLPSGVDHKTVLLGGVQLAERDADDELIMTQVGGRSSLLDRLEVWQTGRPIETTGQVVASVRRSFDREPAAMGAVLEAMARDVVGLRSQLMTDEPSAGRVRQHIGDFERGLERLGVVPPAVREAVRQIEAAGGAAKISGAGTLTGDAAGCLLVFWPEGPPDPLPHRLSAYERQPVDLGVDGLRVEVRE